MATEMSPVSSSHLEALLQLTSSGLDKDEDEEFIAFHLMAVVKTFILTVKENIVKNDDIANLSIKCLTNLTTSPPRCRLLFNLLQSQKLLPVFSLRLCQLSLNKESSLAGLAAGLICNISRDPGPLHEALATAMEIKGLVKAVCQMDQYNPNVESDQLPQVLLNLSQSSFVRASLCDPKKDLIGSLFTFTQVKYPAGRRAAMAGLFKNCCFDDELHSHLLHHPDDFLSALLLPLCGPDDDLREDEILSLPDGLQLVSGCPDTVREPIKEIRIILCEALLQLCSTSSGRQRIRDLELYAILRELHKWEKDKVSILAIEHVVDVLIGDEPETEELKRLRTINIPDEVAQRVDNSNQMFLEDEEEENVKLALEDVK